MSFASETKSEIARIETTKKCCMLAEITGFIKGCGSVRLAGGGKFNIVMTTDSPSIARHYKKLIKQYFGVDVALEVGEQSTLKKVKYYVLVVTPDNLSESILRETGILQTQEGMNYFGEGINENIVKTKCCKKAMLRGLFLGCGTISTPEKGYHLEFVFNKKALAQDITKVLNSFNGVYGKIAERKGKYIVFIKDSEQIVDILAILEASNAVFRFENVKITKGIRNKANRINNCDQANIDKSVMAAERHIKNIRIIDKAIGIENLPDKLREVALLRLEHPDVSLVELGEMLDPPLKKSGVNKRLIKIKEIASKY